jgi:hypothetical protein
MKGQGGQSGRSDARSGGTGSRTRRTPAGDEPNQRLGYGPGGDCVCPSCGTILPHKRGVPCFDVPCPKCGQMMIRK